MSLRLIPGPEEPREERPDLDDLIFPDKELTVSQR